jgi:hypothetical protein
MRAEGCLLFLVLVLLVVVGCIDNATRFIMIKKMNLWLSGESSSGFGSEKKNTKVIRKALPRIIRQYGVKTVLDCPCGDMNYMKHVLLGDNLDISYTGMDIVPELIRENRRQFPNLLFNVGDIESISSPYDLIVMKDLLQHLSTRKQLKILNSIKKSKSRLLLLNNEFQVKTNTAVRFDPAPAWIRTNFTLAPFNLVPVEIVQSDGFDKAYILVNIEDIPTYA